MVLRVICLGDFWVELGDSICRVVACPAVFWQVMGFGGGAHFSGKYTGFGRGRFLGDRWGQAPALPEFFLGEIRGGSRGRRWVIFLGVSGFRRIMGAGI